MLALVHTGNLKAAFWKLQLQKKKKKDTAKAELNASASADDLTEEQQRQGTARMWFFVCVYVFARVH